RQFTAADRAGTERVVIVSDRMARTVWPNRTAVGQCLFVFNDSLPCARVVGVAENLRYGRLREDPPLHLYVPLGQEVGLAGCALLIRGWGSPVTLIPDVRRTLFEIDPSITFADLRTLQSTLEPQVRPGRTGAEVFSLMGLLAVVVAAIGTYGVTAFFV